MRRLISYLSLGFVLSACADQDADIEKARFLLGKGGQANAEEAALILAPLVATDATSGARRLEAVQLYVGSLIGSANFDSVKIISALLYSEDAQLLDAVEEACDDLSDSAKNLLDTAKTTLRDLYTSEDFTNADARTKAGLYFQEALVDFLESLRVLVDLSGLADGSFSVATCRSIFENTDNNILDVNDDTPKAPHVYANAKLTNSSTILQDTSKANLSSENELVEGIVEINQGISTNLTNAEAACNYINSHQ